MDSIETSLPVLPDPRRPNRPTLGGSPAASRRDCLIYLSLSESRPAAACLLLGSEATSARTGGRHGLEAIAHRLSATSALRASSALAGTRSWTPRRSGPPL